METKKLNSYEQTSYWWINRLKSKINQLYLVKKREGNLDNNSELEFLSIFESFGEKDWRNIYLELRKYIKIDVSEFAPSDYFFNMDAFYQDTEKGKHQQLNNELSSILRIDIPDIRLANMGRKDEVIYTDPKGAYVWYKSCGTDQLPKEYESSFNYILTGNKKELEFYNLILSTLIILMEKNNNFNSMDKFRNRFCDEYKKNNNLDIPNQKLIEDFNTVFIMFNRKGLNISNYWHKELYYMPSDLDKNGLDEYKELADYYSDVILNANTNSKQKIITKR